MKEGQYARKQLRDKGISVSELASLFNVASTTAYQYFKSDQLSIDVRAKFKELLSIDTLGFRNNANTDMIAAESDQIHKYISKVSAADYLAAELLRAKNNMKEVRKEISSCYEALDAIPDSDELKSRIRDLLQKIKEMG